MGKIREINVSDLIPLIRNACREMAMEYGCDIRDAIRHARETENERARSILDLLLQNADIASSEQIPICQDTGMIIAFASVGQDVHFTGGSFQEALQEGVRQGYHDFALRASVVADPLYDRTAPPGC